MKRIEGHPREIVGYDGNGVMLAVVDLQGNAAKGLGIAAVFLYNICKFNHIFLSKYGDFSLQNTVNIHQNAAVFFQYQETSRTLEKFMRAHSRAIIPYEVIIP